MANYKILWGLQKKQQEEEEGEKVCNIYKEQGGSGKSIGKN